MKVIKNTRLDVLMFVHVIIFSFTRRIVLSFSLSVRLILFSYEVSYNAHTHNIIKRIRPMDKERKK